MKKIAIISLCVFLTALRVVTGPCQAAATYKIGLSVWTGYPDSIEGFKAAMTVGGLIEGEDVEYLYGKSGIDKEQQRQIAQSFREAQVDLVYSLTTPGTVIIKETMPATTPVVFSIVTYPADSGLIESFDYSGNNLVGTSNYVELTNYVHILKTILPEVKTVGIFHRQGEPNSKIQAANMIRLFKRAGIETLDLEPTSVEEMRSMALAATGKVDAYMTTTDTLCQGGGESALISISLEQKIPILSSNKAGIEEGSTFGPVADFYVLGQMSGALAVKILTENIDPARLQSKIQDPPLLLINKTSVESLGIEIPEEKLENFKYVN